MSKHDQNIRSKRQVKSSRHAKRNGQWISQWRPESLDPDTDPDPDTEPEKRLSYLETVKVVCYNLTAKESRIFLLATKDGLSMAEIGRIEGVRGQAVTQRFNTMARKNGFVAHWLKRKNRKNQYE